MARSEGVRTQFFGDRPSTGDHDVDAEPTRTSPRSSVDRALCVVASRLVMVRVAFGVVWAVDAYLKWQRPFMRMLPTIIATNASHQPGWLAGWFRFWEHVTGDHTLLIGYASAVVETVLAACLILGVGRRVIYLAGALWALGIWSVAEGFGPVLVPGASDLGAAIMHSFIFLSLYWLEAAISPVGLTLDARLDACQGRWRSITQPGGNLAIPVAVDIRAGIKHPRIRTQQRRSKP